MRSIAVLTSPEVPIPAKGLAIIKSLPCETTVCVPDDAIEAMKRGAYDYLVKPFACSELLARVQALARRPPLADVTTQLRIADGFIPKPERKNYDPRAIEPWILELLCAFQQDHR